MDFSQIGSFFSGILSQDGDEIGFNAAPVDHANVLSVVETVLPIFQNQPSIQMSRSSMRDKVSDEGMMSSQGDIQLACDRINALLSMILPSQLESIKTMLVSSGNLLANVPFFSLEKLLKPLSRFIDDLLCREENGKIHLGPNDLSQLVKGLPDDLVLSLITLTITCLAFAPPEWPGLWQPIVEVLILLNNLRTAGAFIHEEEKEDSLTFIPEGHPWFPKGATWSAPKGLLEIVTLPETRNPSSGSTIDYPGWIECFCRFLTGAEDVPNDHPLKKAQEAIQSLQEDWLEFNAFLERLPVSVNPYEDDSTQKKISGQVVYLQETVRKLQVGQCRWMTLSEAGISPLILRIRRDANGKFTLTLFSVGDELGRMGDAHGLLSLHDKGAIAGKAVQLNFFERQEVSLESLCGPHFFRELIWQRCIPNTVLKLANTDELSTRKGLFERYLDGKNAKLPSVENDEKLFYQKSRSQAESFVGALLGKASSFDLLKTIVRHIYLETAKQQGQSLLEAQKAYRYLRFGWTTRVLVAALQPKRQQEDGSFTTRGALAQRLLYLSTGAPRHEIQQVKNMMRAIYKQAWRLAEEMLSEGEKEGFLHQVQSALAPAQQFLHARTKEKIKESRSLFAQGVFEYYELQHHWVPQALPKKPAKVLPFARSREEKSLALLHMTHEVMLGKKVEHNRSIDSLLEVQSSKVRSELIRIAKMYLGLDQSHRIAFISISEEVNVLSPFHMLRGLTAAFDCAQEEQREEILQVGIALIASQNQIDVNYWKNSLVKIVLLKFTCALRANEWDQDSLGILQAAWLVSIQSQIFSLEELWQLAKLPIQEIFVEGISRKIDALDRVYHQGVKFEDTHYKELFYACKLIFFLKQQGRKVAPSVPEAIKNHLVKGTERLERWRHKDSMAIFLKLLPNEGKWLGDVLGRLLKELSGIDQRSSYRRYHVLHHIVAGTLSNPSHWISEAYCAEGAWDRLLMEECEQVADNLITLADRQQRMSAGSEKIFKSLRVLLQRWKRDFPATWGYEQGRLSSMMLDKVWKLDHTSLMQAYYIYKELNTSIYARFLLILNNPFSFNNDHISSTILFSDCLLALLEEKDLSLEEKSILLFQLLDTFIDPRVVPSLAAALKAQGNKIVPLVLCTDKAILTDRIYQFFNVLRCKQIHAPFGRVDMTLDAAFWLALPTPTGQGDSLWEQVGDEKKAYQLAEVLVEVLDSTTLDFKKDGHVALMNAVAILEVLLKQCEELKLANFRFDYSPMICALVKEPALYGKEADWPILSCEAHDKFKEVLRYFLKKEDYDLEHQKMSTYSGQKYVSNQSGLAGLRKTGRLEGNQAYHDPEWHHPVAYVKSYILRKPLPDIKPNLTYYAAQFIYAHDTPEFQTYYKVAKRELAIENYRRAKKTIFHRMIPLGKISDNLNKFCNKLDRFNDQTGRWYEVQEVVAKWRKRFTPFIQEIIDGIDEEKIVQTLRLQMQEWIEDLQQEQLEDLENVVKQDLQDWKNQLEALKAPFSEERDLLSIESDYSAIRSDLYKFRRAINQRGSGLAGSKEHFGDGGPIECLPSAEKLFWQVAETLGASLPQKPEGSPSVRVFKDLWSGSWDPKTDGEKGSKKGYLLPSMPRGKDFPFVGKVGPLSIVSSGLVFVDRRRNLSSFGVLEKIEKSFSKFFGADLSDSDTPYPSPHRIATIEAHGHFPKKVSFQHMREGDFFRQEAAIFSDREGQAPLLLHNFLLRWLCQFEQVGVGVENLKKWEKWIFSPVMFDSLSADMELIRQFTLVINKGYEYYEDKDRLDFCLALTCFSQALKRIYDYRQQYRHPEQRDAVQNITFLSFAPITGQLKQKNSKSLVITGDKETVVRLDKKLLQDFLECDQLFVCPEVQELFLQVTMKYKSTFRMQPSQDIINELASWFSYEEKVVGYRVVPEWRQITWTTEEYEYTFTDKTFEPAATIAKRPHNKSKKLGALEENEEREILGKVCESCRHEMGRLPTTFSRLLPKEVAAVTVWIPIGEEWPSVVYIEVPSAGHSTPKYYAYAAMTGQITDIQSGETLIGANSSSPLGTSLVWALQEDDSNNNIIIIDAHSPQRSKKVYHFRDYGVVFERDSKGTVTVRAFPGYRVEEKGFTDSHLLAHAGQGYLTLKNHLEERKVLVFDKVRGKGVTYVYDLQEKDLPSYKTENRGREILVPASIDSALYAARLCMEQGHYGRAIGYLRRQAHTVSPYTKSQRELLTILWQEARDKKEVMAKVIALRAIYMLESNRLRYDTTRPCAIDWGDFDQTYQEYALLAGSVKKSLALTKEERKDLLRCRYLSALHGEGKQPGLLSNLAQLGQVGASLLNGSMLDAQGLLHREKEEGEEEKAKATVSSLSGMPITMQQELKELLGGPSVPSVQTQKLTSLCEVLPVMAFVKGGKKVDMKRLVQGYERRRNAPSSLDFNMLPPALHIGEETFVHYFGEFYYIVKQGTVEEKKNLQDYLDIMSGNMSLVAHGISDVASDSGFTLYYWLTHKMLAAPELYLDIDADYRRKITWQDRLLELREAMICDSQDPDRTYDRVDGIEVFFDYYDIVRLGSQEEVKALKDKMQADRVRLDKVKEERAALEQAIEQWEQWKAGKPNKTPWKIDPLFIWINCGREAIQARQERYSTWKGKKPAKKITLLDYLRVRKLTVDLRLLETQIATYPALEELLQVEDRPHVLPSLDRVDREALRNKTPLDEARAIDLAWSVSGFDITHLWRFRNMALSLAQAGWSAIVGTKDDIKLAEHYESVSIPNLPSRKEGESLPLPIGALRERHQGIMANRDINGESKGLLGLFHPPERLPMDEDASSLQELSIDRFPDANSKAKFREIQTSVKKYRRPQPKICRFAAPLETIPEVQKDLLWQVHDALEVAHAHRQECLETVHQIASTDTASHFHSHLHGKVTWEQLTSAYFEGTYEAYQAVLPTASPEAIRHIDQRIAEHDLYILLAKQLAQISDALGKAYAAWKASSENKNDPECLEYLAQGYGVAFSMAHRGSLEELFTFEGQESCFKGFSEMELDKMRRVFLRFEAKEGKILRPKQLRILGQALSALKRGERTVIFEAGTGTGKSKVLEILLGVLAPRLMRDAPGAFGVYTWPSSLAATNKNDMHSQAMEVFDFQVAALHFSYKNFTKEKEGIIIELYEQFMRAFVENKLVNSKPEDWQSLELAVIEKLTDPDACKEIPHLIHMGVNMLRVLRSHGLQLPDETQITCGPKRLVKHRLGEKSSLAPYHLDVHYALHVSLLACSLGDDDFKWSTGQATAIFNDYEQQVLAFEHDHPETFGCPDTKAGRFLYQVAEHTLQGLIELYRHQAGSWSVKLSEHFVELLAYLTDKRRPPLEDWEDERKWPEDLRLALDGLRGQITFLLPKTLSLSYLSEFGESPDPKKSYMVFWEKGIPQKDPSVELDLILEAGNQTLRGWLVKGLNQDLVRRLITQLIRDAEAERKRHQNKLSIKDTRAGALFHCVLQGHYAEGKVPHLMHFAKDLELLPNKVFNAICHHPQMILYAVTYLILPEIPVYEKKIESNSANLLSQFKGRLGGSATPGHRLQYGLDTFFIPDEDNVLGEMITFQDSMLAKGNIRGYEAGNAGEVLKQLVLLIRANDQEEGARPTRAFIDLTGLLNGIEPEEFQQAVQELYRDDPQVAGLLLFAKSEDGQEERLVMHHLHEGRKEPVEQSRLSPTRYFVYINQGGAVGTDTKMHPVCQGLLSINTLTTLQDAAQGWGRMRNKGQGQEVVFLLPKKELAKLLGKDENDPEVQRIAGKGFSQDTDRALLQQLSDEMRIQGIVNQVRSEEGINDGAFGFLLLDEVRKEMIDHILNAKKLKTQSARAKKYHEFLVTNDSQNFSMLFGGIRKNLPMQKALEAMVNKAEEFADKYFSLSRKERICQSLCQYREAIHRLFPEQDDLVEEIEDIHSTEDRPFLLPASHEGKGELPNVNTAVSVQADVALQTQVDVQNNVQNNIQMHTEGPHGLPVRRHRSSLWKEDLDLFGTPWYHPEGTFHLRAAVVSKAVRSFDVLKSMAFGKPGEFLAGVSQIGHSAMSNWKKIIVFSLVGSVLMTLFSLGMSAASSYGFTKLTQAIKATAQKALAIFRKSFAYAWMQQHPAQSTLVGISSATLVLAGGYKIYQCRSKRNLQKAKDRGVGIYLLDAVAPDKKLFGDKILVTNNYLAKKPVGFFEPVEDLHSRENTPLTYTIIVAIKQEDPEHPYDFRYILAGKADADCFATMLKKQVPPAGCRISIAVRYFDGGLFAAQSSNWPDELSHGGLQENNDFAALDNLVRFGVSGQTDGYLEDGILGMQERIAGLAHGNFAKGAQKAAKNYAKQTVQFKPTVRDSLRGSQLESILSEDRRQPVESIKKKKIKPVKKGRFNLQGA